METNNPKHIHMPGRVMIAGTFLGIICLYGLLSVQSDLRTAVPLLVLVTAAIIILLAVLACTTDRYSIKMSPWLILAIAALIRTMFIFRPPELSDDIYRYVWDGMQILFGSNPYALAPVHVPPQTFAAGQILSSVNHPGLVTVYPPGAQVVFLWGALVSQQVWGLKCLLTLMDLGSCAMLLCLLPRFGLPRVNSILYAWHPLVVLEISGSGHIDAAGIFFFYLSLCMAAFVFSSFDGKAKRPYLCIILSGAAYAWSCLVKLFPVFFFPVFFRRVPPRYRPGFLAGAFSGALLLCLPFLPQLKNMLGTLFQYARHWEFSGLVYSGLRSLGLSGDGARYILGALFISLLSVIWVKPFAPSSPGNFPKGPLFLFSSIYTISLVFLFLSPTVHPWYALYLVSMLPFVPSVSGFILSWSVLLAYSVLIPYALTGRWMENSCATVLIWAGPAGAFIIRQMIVRLSYACQKTGRC